MTQQPEQNSAIEVRSASYAYRPSSTAFRNLSFSLEEGGFLALLGRNGAGKSSLVHCLMGFLKATEGSLSILGLDPWSQRRELMKHVSLVPEAPNVPPQMSPRSAARFRSKFLGGRFDHSFFDALLERGNVDRTKSFRSLSRGQKTQTTIALALASRPALLILDDPTLGLDAVARTQLYQLLIEQQSEWEHSVLITTHDLGALDGLASHVGFLNQGELVEYGRVEELKSTYRLLDVGPGEEPKELGSAKVLRRHTSSLSDQLLLRRTEGGAAATALPGTVPTIEELFVALLQDQDTPEAIDKQADAA